MTKIMFPYLQITNNINEYDKKLGFNICKLEKAQMSMTENRVLVSAS